MRFLLRRHSVLPGFGLALGFTVLYLSLVVLVPLAGQALAQGICGGQIGGILHGKSPCEIG